MTSRPAYSPTSLVGRDIALQGLERAFESRPGVLLVGEAGVGKTFLARAFAERRGGRGPAASRVAALPGLHDRPLSALRPLLGPGPVGGQDPVEWAVSQLAARCQLLVVDDVDALDELSGVVLHRIAGHRRDGRTAPWLLLTLRSGRVLPTPLERLVTEGDLEQLTLRPFAEPDVARMAAEMLGGPVDPLAVHMLHERSRGNPLFVRELVRAGHDDDAWVRRTAGWVLTKEVSAAERVGPLLELRLAGLGEPARQLGHVLALLGPLPADIVLALGLLDGLRPLVAAGLADQDAAGIGLTHPLVGEAFTAAADSAEEERLVARALEASAEHELPVTATVRLTAVASRSPGAVDAGLLAVAARLALGLHDPELARQLADAALAAGVREPETRVTGLQAGAMLGDESAARSLGALTDAVDDDLREAARLAVARLRVAGPDGATEALELVGDNGGSTGAAMRAIAHLRQADWPAAASAAGRALELATDQAEWLDAAAIASLLKVTDDDIAGGLAMAQRGLAMLDAGARSAPHVPLLLTEAAVVGAVLAGEPALADRLVHDDSNRPGEDAANRTVAAHRTMRRGYVALFRGRLATAELHLSAAASLLPPDDPVDIRAWTLGHLAQTQAMRGDLDGADGTVALGRAAVRAGQVTQLTPVLHAEAWIAAGRGDIDEARRLTHKLLAGTESSPLRRALTWLDLARFGDLEAAAPHLVGAGEATVSPAIHHAEALVTDLARGDTDAALGAADRLADAGLALWAADLLAAAAAHEEAAAALRSRALLLSLACEDAATPALTRLGLSVTPMQRRVAELAAQGLTNRQVGEALGMSPRTAATHLHRLYKVLGVNSREDLARLMG